MAWVASSISNKIPQTVLIRGQIYKNILRLSCDNARIMINFVRCTSLAKSSD